MLERWRPEIVVEHVARSFALNVTGGWQVEVHTGDFQLVRSYLVKQAITRGCSLCWVAVERDGDLGLIDLNVREVDDVAPYQNRVFAIADQIARMTRGVAWERHRLNARQDVFTAEGNNAAIVSIEGILRHFEEGLEPIRCIRANGVVAPERETVFVHEQLLDVAEDWSLQWACQSADVVWVGMGQQDSIDLQGIDAGSSECDLESAPQPLMPPAPVSIRMVRSPF